MNDSIYRQAAIDAVRKCSVKEVTPAFMLVDKAEVMTELMMLPSAQPQQRWIPVSERLPEVSGSYYLVSEHSPLGEFTCIRYWNQGDRRGYWSGDGYSTVTAWMPLPEPYREDGE